MNNFALEIFVDYRLIPPAFLRRKAIPHLFIFCGSITIFSIIPNKAFTDLYLKKQTFFIYKVRPFLKLTANLSGFFIIFKNTFNISPQFLQTTTASAQI